MLQLLTFITLLSVSLQDVYDGTVDSNTDECSFIDEDCQCDYYVELTTNQGRVYVVPPHECLLVPFWVMALMIMIT